MEIKDYVIAQKLRLIQRIKKEARAPHLLIIQVNDNFASGKYIKGKCDDAAFVGIKVTHIKLSDPSEADVLAIIEKANKDDGVDGIIVQLPLPQNISEDNIKLAIDPRKDVDGFHPLSHFDPCTPRGAINYLKAENIVLRGKNALVVGRSNIVGKPAASMLLAEDANVIVVHSKTSKEDLAFFLKHADIIFVAVGIKHFISDETLKKSAVIVDVGINRDESGSVTGDVKPARDVFLQTPVPGGVGLLTRLTLLENVYQAFLNKSRK